MIKRFQPVIPLMLFGFLFSTPPVHAQEKVRITYGNNSLSFLIPFIAKDRSFYAKNGLNAELVQVRPGVAIAALTSGDANFAEVLGSAVRCQPYWGQREEGLFVRQKNLANRYGQR